MSDEHDSGFESAFGVDLGRAVSKVKKEASAAAGVGSCRNAASAVAADAGQSRWIVSALQIRWARRQER